MAYDFSFTNPEIKNWFDKEQGSAPTRHFIYLHEHPLIKPNFISELDAMIYEAGAYMIRKNIKGSSIKRLHKLGTVFGGVLTAFSVDRSEKNAEEVLEAMRELYKFCKQIKSM